MAEAASQSPPEASGGIGCGGAPRRIGGIDSVRRRAANAEGIFRWSGAGDARAGGAGVAAEGMESPVRIPEGQEGVRA